MAARNEVDFFRRPALGLRRGDAARAADRRLAIGDVLSGDGSGSPRASRNDRDGHSHSARGKRRPLPNAKGYVARRIRTPGTITVVLNGPAEMAAQLRRSLSRPPRLVLWTQHAPNQPGVRGLSDPACRSAWDRVVCVSDWHRSVICEQLGVPYEQIRSSSQRHCPRLRDLFPDADSLTAQNQQASDWPTPARPFAASTCS